MNFGRYQNIDSTRFFSTPLKTGVNFHARGAEGQISCARAFHVICEWCDNIVSRALLPIALERMIGITLLGNVPRVSELAAIAHEAGDTILALQRGELAATAKADGSPVTQADLASNETILRGLAGKFPDVPVLTEERAPDHTATKARHIFLVDPLDGTRDFLGGHDDYTVNIALLEDGTPVAGVVYAPALGVVYAGAMGEGAQRARVANGLIGVWQTIAAVAPAEKLRAVTSRSHPSSKTQEYLEGLVIGDLTRVGSSLKFCLIAAGEADVYPRMGQTMEWDTAAGDAILRAAGGTVADMDGQPLRYNKRNAAGGPDLVNPWFVASGRFNIFDPKWHRGGAVLPANCSPARTR